MKRTRLLLSPLLTLIPAYFLFVSCDVEQEKVVLKRNNVITTDNSREPTSEIGTETIQEDGAALYKQHCASCHNPFDQSQKKYVGSYTNLLERTQTAVRVLPDMQHLSSLSESHIITIAKALTTDGTQPTAEVPVANSDATPSHLEGARLYQANCANCHGPLDTSAKRGRNFDAINQAIEKEPSMALTRGLSGEQRRLITDALNQSEQDLKKSAEIVKQEETIAGATQGDALVGDAAEDGAKLYEANCASCHGALITSTKLDRSADTIKGAISAVPAMNNLMSLSMAQLESISMALSTEDLVDDNADNLYKGFGGVNLVGSNLALTDGDRSTVRTFSLIIAEVEEVLGSRGNLDSIASAFGVAGFQEYVPGSITGSTLDLFHAETYTMAVNLLNDHKSPKEDKLALLQKTRWAGEVAYNPTTLCTAHLHLLVKSSPSDEEIATCLNAYNQVFELEGNKVAAAGRLIAVYFMSTYFMSH